MRNFIVALFVLCISHLALAGNQQGNNNYGTNLKYSSYNQQGSNTGNNYGKVSYNNGNSNNYGNGNNNNYGNGNNNNYGNGNSNNYGYGNNNNYGNGNNNNYGSGNNNNYGSGNNNNYGNGNNNNNYGYSNGYGHNYNNSHKGFRFPPPQHVVDPYYYASILDDFQACVSQTCDSSSNSVYQSNITDALQVVGKYTSCVTECSAYQAVRAMRDLKNLIAALFDIAAFKLTAVRQYMADAEYFDVIGNRTRIYDSCCLPKDRFVAWDRLFIPLTLTYTPDGQAPDSFSKMISVADYLSYCTSTEPIKGWLSYYTITCNSDLTSYLENLQRNVGTLVLAPSCASEFPDGGCSKNADRNPRAQRFPSDVCVAYESSENGQPGKFTIPLVRELKNHQCQDDKILVDSKHVTVRFRRVHRHTLKYYTVTTGFPSSIVPGNPNNAIQNFDKSQLAYCKYDGGIAKLSADGNFFDPAADLGAVGFNASLRCPFSGRFEYCNVQQYAGYLEKELFDVSKCNINDFAHQGHYGQGAYWTLACQYRVLSLKCDCMEAVMNCYNSEYQFNTALGKLFGKAASIMCGLILCQKPKIFSLFGELEAIDKAQLMKQLLLQAGAMVPDNRAVPPATVAFFTFGLGMVAFVVVKTAVKSYRRKSINNEDGYRNLI